MSTQPPAVPSDSLVRIQALDAAEAAAGDAGESWLTAQESARLQAITAPQRRRQYLAGHWLLRQLAAQACGGEPARWRFAAGPDPRPRLACEGLPPLWASLSHSGDRVAAAVARQPIGLDLEQPRRSRDLVALANFLFAPEEAATVEGATEGLARSAVFYTLWTLKEARGKRSGEGLQPAQARRVAARPCAPAEAEAWHWALPEQGSLALAAWPGLAPRVEGLPTGTQASAWRYLPLD